MSKQTIDRIMTQARDARQAQKARTELNAAQDAAAEKIAKLLKALTEYQDQLARDLHPTWPQIGSANLIIASLEDAVRHINSIPKEVR